MADGPEYIKVPESPYAQFIITQAGAFTPEAVERLVHEREQLVTALGNIRSSLTALATGGIGETEFAEEVQEQLDSLAGEPRD